MKIVGIIPARYGSTRLPGKPLKDILGYPMIWWVYNCVLRAEKLDEVFVATDDERIKNTCDILQIPVIMTASTHSSAAERLQEVSESIAADFYVQLNGDEPLIDVDAINACVPEVVPQGYEFGTNIITKMTDPAQVMDPSNIKVVFDDQMNALYMSRVPIPYPYGAIDFEYYKHVGIIGYNKKMLDFYRDSNPGRWEIIEGIDTMRFLDYGKKLKFVLVSTCHNLSVDTEKDLEMVCKLLEQKK